MALTGEPLSYNDIISGVNLTIASRYLNISSVIIFILMTVGGILVIGLNKKLNYISKTTQLNYLFIVIFIGLITPFAFSPYIDTFLKPDNILAQKIKLKANQFDVVYYSWDWPGNVRAHGLPMHLIQTSVRKSVPAVTEEERINYYKLKEKFVSAAPTKHNTIIYILCESCWYDEKHFSQNFLPLINVGYIDLRAISPVYGAGTANAEFEMLTGLPSNSGVLSGIIYQEYSGMLKETVETLASSLKHNGFKTYAAHNNNKSFWRRDVVYRKFGFEQFEGFSEMGDLPAKYAVNKKSWQWQPDDYLLYNAALKALKNANGEKVFMNLITMSTHGPFLHIDDFGEGVYRHEIDESIERIIEFTQKVEEIDPNALIVIYGDHKPSLNRYFFEHGVFDASFFAKTGIKDEDFAFNSHITPKQYGDVPVLIKSKNIENVNALILEANNKPFYCLSAFIDKYFIHSGLFAFNYNLENGCKNGIYDNYTDALISTPSWVFSLSLFEN